MEFGFDLSSSQGVLTAQHWATIAASGCKFVFIECGIGNDGLSSTYHTYMAAAKSVGLIAIPYHFCYILPNAAGHINRSPEDQAILHYSYCQSNAAIDIEWPTSDKWAEFGIPAGAAGAAFIRDWTMRYLAKYAALCGATPLVYTYPSYAQQMAFPAEIANYPLWIASYEPTPTIPAPWKSWSVWQTNGGTNGVRLPNGSAVDQDCVESLDVFNSLLGVQPTPAPIVAPTPDPVAVVPEPVSTPVIEKPLPTNFWQSFVEGLSKLFG